jgi:hypothetical protein
LVADSSTVTAKPVYYCAAEGNGTTRGISRSSLPLLCILAVTCQMKGNRCALVHTGRRHERPRSAHPDFHRHH